MRRWLETFILLEREKGIEPSPIAWEAIVLPLNYSRSGSNKLEDSTALATRARMGITTGFLMLRRETQL
jgi:hypothetical protein